MSLSQWLEEGGWGGQSFLGWQQRREGWLNGWMDGQVDRVARFLDGKIDV